jgi:hypothetical protein
MISDFYDEDARRRLRERRRGAAQPKEKHADDES